MSGHVLVVMITTADLLERGFKPHGDDAVTTSFEPDSPTTFREAKERTVQAFEHRFLGEALRRVGGNVTREAETVGMYRQSFQQKMRALEITADPALNGAQKGVGR